MSNSIFLEPGTANKNPAGVIIESNPSPQINKDDYKADNGDYKHQGKFYYY